MEPSINKDLLFSNEILDLTLLPTEQCNFRCTYCYEDFTDGKMKPGIVRGIKLLIEKRAEQLQFLRLGWFGGEPLLAHDLVLDISDFAKKLADKHSQLTFVGGMSTNGYLLDVAMMEKLVAAGVSAFQVSVDGPRASHDTLRVRRNGAGTFERIWKNLLSLKNSDVKFDINIRVHYSRDNIVGVLELTQMLKENFCNDPRFRIFFKTIEKLGGDNDDSFSLYNRQEAAEIKQMLLDKFDGGIKESIPANSCYVCYAGKANAFVIRRNGSIVKCTVGLDDKENQVGQIHEDGTMKINNKKIRPWLEGAVNLDSAFLSCPRSKLDYSKFT